MEMLAILLGVGILLMLILIVLMIILSSTPKEDSEAMPPSREEVVQIKMEMRPLYFGLKNIILKEIENIDKEIDIQKFFFSSQVSNQDPYISQPTSVM